MSRINKKFTKDVIPAMKQKFGYKNDLSVPRLIKVVVNVGINQSQKDDKLLDKVIEDVTKIVGQKPVQTKAKKSISAFKIREGVVVGVKATLRGKRMYNFVDKLVNVTLARVRDFRGLEPKSVDQQGNLTIGFQEYIVFPEIRSDDVERLHGLEVTVSTNAKTKEEGLELLKLLGFPFK